MATVHFCDKCGKKINSMSAVHFLGSKRLSNVIFCENCFQEIEKFIINKYGIKPEDKKIYG
jgi:hypothetical protein